MFKKYDKVERWDHASEVDGILDGWCYIQEKLDGANTSAWRDGNIIAVGKRSQEIARLDLTDNHWEVGDAFRGYVDYVFKNPCYSAFFNDCPELRLYQEWLVKHTLDYFPQVMGAAYVFDIFDDVAGKFLSPDAWIALAEVYHLPFIPIIDKIYKPTFDQLRRIVNERGSQFRDGNMEGIVEKNYEFENKWGNRPFMKMVHRDFFETHKVVFNVGDKKESVEWQICTSFITRARVRKIVNSIVDDGKELSMRIIPEVLGRMYHDLIIEDVWQIVTKKFKGATINFNQLRRECDGHTKVLFTDLLQKEFEHGATNPDNQEVAN